MRFLGWLHLVAAMIYAAVLADTDPDFFPEPVNAALLVLTFGAFIYYTTERKA